MSCAARTPSRHRTNHPYPSLGTGKAHHARPKTRGPTPPPTSNTVGYERRCSLPYPPMHQCLETENTKNRAEGNPASQLGIRASKRSANREDDGNGVKKREDSWIEASHEAHRRRAPKHTSSSRMPYMGRRLCIFLLLTERVFICLGVREEGIFIVDINCCSDP